MNDEIIITYIILEHNRLFILLIKLSVSKFNFGIWY